MPSVYHISRHIKQYGLTNKALYALSFMLLFWGIFDGIISYITPLVITQNGFSKTEMGIIIGSSAIAGAFFDLTLCRLFAQKHYRYIFLIMLITCLIYPLILYSANSFIFYLLAMAVWSFYYDLKNIARFDFMARKTSGRERTSSFGVNSAFISLGYLLAPILAGLVIGSTINWEPFILSWIFVILAFIFFFVLLSVTKRDRIIELENKEVESKKNFFLEFKMWQKVGKVLLPVLILTICLNIFDSFFWTLGPILSQELESFGHYGGLILAAYQLPILILGWFVGSFTSRFGKKRTAFFAFLTGSLIITFILLSQSLLFIILIVFLSSSALAIAWPSINGAYADYLDESENYVAEIATLEDFCTNLGYIIGPIFAGILADYMGELNSFSAIGFFGIVISLILLIITPKKINIDKQVEAEL